MKLAVIDNYDSFVFNLIRYMKEVSEVEVVVMRNDRINYTMLDEVDAILLSPGPGIPSEAGDLLKIIDRYATEKNILGICLGHQAIGEYFGVQLKQSISPVHGKASKVIKKEEDVLFEGIDSGFQVGRYHSWCLSDQFPKQLKVTAVTEDHEIMAIRHETLKIRGVQFHPESILTPTGRKMIENWVKDIQLGQKNN